MQIAQTASAIRFHGDGGGRVQFDFSDTEKDEVLKLLEMRQKRLQVTIEGVED